MGKKIIQGNLEVTDGIKLQVPDATIGGDHFGNELIYVARDCNILASSSDILIRVNDEQLQLYNLADPQNELDAATKKYVDSVQTNINEKIENQKIEVMRFI